jgi:hypothetical protein
LLVATHTIRPRNRTSVAPWILGRGLANACASVPEARLGGGVWVRLKRAASVAEAPPIDKVSAPDVDDHERCVCVFIHEAYAGDHPRVFS